MEVVRQRQPAPQPDFRSLAGDFNRIGEQMARFENIPAVDGGAQLLRAIGELREWVLELRRDVVELRVEMKVINRNFTSRLANSVVVARQMSLAPLYNSTTGQEVENCPATLMEIEECEAPRAAAILRELGEDVPRALEEKRRRLKLAFGVRTQLVSEENVEVDIKQPGIDNGSD
ncbi:hypothetical protein E4U53_007004 [Claviceps sorghi]|nr:hypothetical protein E4U53_007004 [Claviceps sorghi]